MNCGFLACLFRQGSSLQSTLFFYGHSLVGPGSCRALWAELSASPHPVGLSDHEMTVASESLRPLRSHIFEYRIRSLGRSIACTAISCRSILRLLSPSGSYCLDFWAGIAHFYPCSCTAGCDPDLRLPSPLTAGEHAVVLAARAPNTRIGGSGAWAVLPHHFEHVAHSQFCVLPYLFWSLGASISCAPNTRIGGAGAWATSVEAFCHPSSGVWTERVEFTWILFLHCLEDWFFICAAFAEVFLRSLLFLLPFALFRLWVWAMPGRCTPLGRLLRTSVAFVPCHALLPLGCATPSTPVLSWTALPRKRQPYAKKNHRGVRTAISPVSRLLLWLCGFCTLPRLVWAVPEHVIFAGATPFRRAAIDAFLANEPPSGFFRANCASGPAGAGFTYVSPPVFGTPMPREIVPDPLPTLGITVFAPHYVPTFFGLTIPSGADVETVAAAVQALGHVPGPGFDAFIPVRCQRHNSALAFLTYPSVIQRLSPPRCAVLVDLTRVGGHYFAETIPAAITLAEFLQLFGKNMWYDAEEVLVWVDGSELPASPGELAFAHGSVFEVMLRQYHPGRACTAEDVLRSAAWGPFVQSPSPRRHAGNAVADGVCVTHTRSSLLAPVDTEQSVIKVLGLSPLDRVLHTERYLQLDIRGDQCHTVYTGPARLHPWLIDLRPLGFQMTVLYRDVEPGVEDVQHLTQSVFPPGCVVTAHCVTQHDKRHLYLPVIQVDVQDIGDAPVAPLCSEIGGSDTGQTQCKGPSEATSNLRAAVEAVAQEHPGLLPEPFHRIGPVPPFLPQPVEADTDEDVEGADEPRTVRATCLLFVYEMTHEEVHLSLPVPCTVQGMLDALTQQCDDARYTLFPQHVPVDPQPTQWWIAVIALPPWANAEPLILLNLDTIDGRCFVASVRTPFNRSHILRIAQLVDDGTYEVFPFYAFTPMQADDLIELVPYGTVTVRRAGARRVVQGHGLHTMLLAGTTWDDDPTLPIPPAGNRSLLVHEHGHGLVHPRSGNDMPTPAEVAAVCGANADTVQVIEASPQPLNALCCGYLCQKVLGVSFTEDNLLTPGQPYTGVTFVDCRALLLGWSLEVSLEGRLRHSTVVDWLDTFSPDGWQPQLTGAPIDDEGWLHAAPGSILVAEYVPVTSSEEGEVQGAGSTSDSSPGDDDESTVDERDAHGPADPACSSDLPDRGPPEGNEGNVRERSRSPRAHNESRPSACALVVACVACASTGLFGQSLLALSMPTVGATTGALPEHSFHAPSWLDVVWREITVATVSVQLLFFVCKILAEPQPTTLAGCYTLAALRYAAPRLGRVWRYVPPSSAVFIEEDDPIDTDSDSEDARVRWIHFAVLVPGFAPALVACALQLPVTLAEAVAAVQTARAPASVRAFPRITQVCPQPCPGTGVFVADQAWSQTARPSKVHLCFDVSDVDGRVYSVLAPSYLTRQQLIVIADLPPRLDICVYAATDDFPLADDVLLHFSTGDTIRFVHPGGPPPSQDTLPAALLTTRGWTDRSTLPVPQVDNVYCLVHRDGNVMYFANHAEPMAYRTRIATALGLGRQGFRLFPAVPRVTDAYLDGIPCRTVIAVCETGQEFPEPFVGVLFDLRAVSQGWRAIYAYHGRVHCPGLFEDVREFIPLGWAPALRHVPLHTVFLDVQAGQVLVLELHPYVTRAPDALAPTVGPDAATEGETSDVGGMHAAAHSATAPDGAIDTVEDAAEAAGHHSTETAAEDTEDITIAGDAVVGTSLHVLVFTPEYAPETIHIRVELPLTIAELTAIVTPLRDATVRFRFPQLISPPVQPAFATACLLALPAWDPPCVPILIACYVSPVRVFADVVPAVLTPGDVCRLAQVTDDGQCRVFHADVPWAVPDDTRFHVQAGDLVIVLPVEQPYVPPVLLQYMLLHPEGWQQGPCPFGPYEDGVWLLTDQVHRFFAAPAPPRPPIKEAVADLVGVPYDSLTFMPASPPIRDQARYGLPARQVFVAMQQLHPDAVPYIIDCRPVLLGFLCAFAPDGIVQVANVCGHHVHRCPPGYFVRLTGGARQSDTDNHYRVVFPGQVLVLDYCPRRVSLPFDASAAGPGSDDDDDDHPPGDDRDLDEPDDPSEDATSSRPDAGTGSTQCFPPAEESAAAGSSHHSAMCSLVFAKWGSGSHAHAFPEGHRYFTPDKSLLTALLKLFCLCSAGFLLLRVLPALFLCATACHTFSRRSSLPSRPGLLLRLCVALLLHMYVPAVDAVQLPIEPKLDGRLADTAVRPLPTPCRRPALELPGTEQAVCTSVDPRRPQSRTVDDIASFSFELLTLLEESAARPDFEGFFDASTLLDTLVEHFGLAAVDHDPDPACDVGVVLCLHESVPPTPFQVRALELQAIVPAPVDPAAYWDGVVLDWLDVDLSHILTATDLPDTLRRSFLALPTAAQLDPQATVSSLVIYTDGSAGRRHDCDISPAAWSFAVWACQNSELYLLGHSAHSTVPCGTPFFLGEPDDTPFTAECLALAWALVWSLEYGAGLGVPIEFRYDCVGAGLGTFGRAQLCAKDSTEGHATLFSFLGILRQALELRATVHHCHVRGHSGDPGNELCDRLAKAARRVPEDCQERCLPAWPHQWFVHPLASWGWLATYARSDLPTLAALEAESVRLQTSEARPSAPSMGMHTCKHQPSTTGYDIAVATFNVLSLFDPQAPKGRQKRVPNVGMMIAGKKDLLKQQFLAKQLWLVGLQETRLPTQSTLPDADFVILCTAANAAGQYGCALWVNKHVVYARDDGTEHRLRSEHLVVAACSERYLQVHIVAPRLKLAVLVVHGPKAKHDHDPEVRLFWQARLCDLRRRPKGSDYIVLTDANAHLGSVETDHVGGHGVEPENWEGECFHEFLCQAGACLPSTFALHVGQNWTWRAPGQAATVHRLDYVAIPTEWKSFVTESTVWCDIEALQARQDHLPACLSLSFRKTMPAHYSSHLTRSACRPTTTPTDAMRHAFTQALRRSGSVAWSVDVDQHFHSWVDNIKHAAESLCEAAVKTPRQPYLCEHTLGLVERRRALRFLLRQEEAEYRRRTLMIAFAAVVLHTRQDVFTPTTAARAEDWLISLDHSIAMLVRLFHEATTAIRAAVKRDRQQYLASLADQVTMQDLRDPKSLYAAVRRAFPAAKSSRRSTFQPLPAVEMPDGQLAITPEAKLDR